MSYEPTVAAAAPAPGHPVRFDVEYPEKLSRLLIFFKWLLAIPHFVVVYVLSLIAGLFGFIGFFSILFTKKYPEGLFGFVVNVYRWQANVNAYVGLLRDEYPPFSWEPGKYAVTYEVDYPQELNRWLPLIKWLLVIPNLIVFVLFAIVAAVLWIIGWLAILFTGSMPRGIFDFLVGINRWSYRINAYIYFLTDQYPPFGLK